MNELLIAIPTSIVLLLPIALLALGVKIYQLKNKYADVSWILFNIIVFIASFSVFALCIWENILGTNPTAGIVIISSWFTAFWFFWSTLAYFLKCLERRIYNL